MPYFDIIVPKNGKLEVIQCNHETVDNEFEKQETCVVYRWLDFGYARVAQKNLGGFCDKKPIMW